MSFEDYKKSLARLKRAHRAGDLAGCLVGRKIVESENIHRHLVFGLARRLRLLQRSYDFFVGLIERGGGKPLHGAVQQDAQIHLNSFYVQIRGSLDNMAWAFLHSRNAHIDEEDKNQRKKANLRGKDFLRDMRSVDVKLADYVESIYPWFDDLKAFRDPIAHRVPIYTPPSAMTSQQQQESKDAFQETFQLIQAGGDDEGIKAAMVNLKGIGTYIPMISRETEGGTELIPLLDQMEKDLDQLFELIVRFWHQLMVESLCPQ
jgi:hypothetical protein